MYLSPRFPFKTPDLANAHACTRTPPLSPPRNDQGFPICWFDSNYPVYDTVDVTFVSATGPKFDQHTPVQHDREYPSPDSPYDESVNGSAEGPATEFRQQRKIGDEAVDASDGEDGRLPSSVDACPTLGFSFEPRTRRRLHFE